MSRIGLIGDNSTDYVKIVINAWNNGDSVVLIDSSVPPLKCLEMLIEAKVSKCYVENKFYKRLHGVIGNTVKLVSYSNNINIPCLLPEYLYDDFQEVYSEDEAVILYSSGTTGESKGIILSHFAINKNADYIIEYMRLSSNDCMYIVKNIVHSSTFTGELIVALKTKIPLVISPIVVPPRYALNNIAKYSVSVICINPSLLSMYCEELKRKLYDISSLKKIYVSGSILSDKVYNDARSIFKLQEIYNVYGLSEAGPRVTAQQYGNCHKNSVGRPIGDIEIAIIDSLGKIVPNGERGIIHVNTPCRFSGYVKGNLKHISLYGNWLNTGDIGYFDEYDELHILGRIDDMIIIDSHKIYPYEVERIIMKSDKIKECVVAAVNFHNKDILCCLYVSDNKVSDDIKMVLGRFLMKHEIPRFFLKTNAIPKTFNGKVSLKGVKEVIMHELERGIEYGV